MTSTLVSSVLIRVLCVTVFAVVDPSLATSTPNATATNATAAAAATATTITTPQLPKTYQQIYLQTICENQRSCHLVGNVSETDRTLAVRNCMCDAECNVYGDCCFDSPFYNDEDQKTNFKRFHCPKENWYLKASCVAGYEDGEIVRRCADGVKSASNDVRVITPVTDVERNVTYANVYCAMCDERDPRLPALRPWNVTFRCEVNATTSREAAPGDRLEASWVARNLSWDEAQNEYRAYYRGRAYKCEPLRQPSADVGVVGRLRRCAVAVADCPATTDARLAADCAAFTLLVHDEALSYRNAFCAQCNGATTAPSGCRFQVEDRFSTPQRIFSGANKANGNAACSDPNVNPDLKKRFCPP